MQTLSGWQYANLTIDKWQINLGRNTLTLVVHDSGTPANVWTIDVPLSRVMSGDKTPTVT